MKYRIEDVKVGVGEGGFACGPIDGPVVCELTLRDEEGNLEYHDLIEVMGCPHFFESTKSCYEKFLAEDEDMIEELNDSGDGFCDYYELFDELQSQDEDTVSIWRYLIYMARADWDEVDAFKAITVGKYLNEIAIPVSEEEEEYLEN